MIYILGIIFLAVIILLWVKHSTNKREGVTTTKQKEKHSDQYAKKQEIALYTCGRCGGEVKRRTKVCPHCRVLLRSVKCISCNTVYSQDLPRCPKCGLRNIHTNSTNCCLCHKILVNPGESENSDDIARFCIKCGMDICVHCIQKLKKGEGYSDYICPECKKIVYFEIDTRYRPFI